MNKRKGELRVEAKKGSKRRVMEERGGEKGR